MDYCWIKCLLEILNTLNLWVKIDHSVLLAKINKQVNEGDVGPNTKL